MPYKDPMDKLVYKAKIRAVRKGLAFSITKDDLEMPDFCPILHIPLFPGVGHSWSFSPTIDRIDNSLGYIQGNVWIISCLANQMKSSANDDTLETFANWVLSRNT